MDSTISLKLDLRISQEIISQELNNICRFLKRYNFCIKDKSLLDLYDIKEPFEDLKYNEKYTNKYIKYTFINENSNTILEVCGLFVKINVVNVIIGENIDETIDIFKKLLNKFNKILNKYNYPKYYHMERIIICHNSNKIIKTIDELQDIINKEDLYNKNISYNADTPINLENKFKQDKGYCCLYVCKSLISNFTFSKNVFLYEDFENNKNIFSRTFIKKLINISFGI